MQRLQALAQNNGSLSENDDSKVAAALLERAKSLTPAKQHVQQWAEYFAKLHVEHDLQQADPQNQQQPAVKEVEMLTPGQKREAEQQTAGLEQTLGGPRDRKSPRAQRDPAT